MNLFLTSLKLIFGEIVVNILYFPIWWYTKGFLDALFWAGRQIHDIEESLAIKIWVVNIFRPMFGEHTLSGKVISFFMRIVQIIFRTIILLLWSILILALILLWLVLPIFIVWQIWHQFQGILQ